MKVITEIESVNLSNGDRTRRVVGDGESRIERSRGFVDEVRLGPSQNAGWGTMFTQNGIQGTGVGAGTGASAGLAAFQTWAYGARASSSDTSANSRGWQEDMEFVANTAAYSYTKFPISTYGSTTAGCFSVFFKFNSLSPGGQTIAGTATGVSSGTGSGFGGINIGGGYGYH